MPPTKTDIETITRSAESNRTAGRVVFWLVLVAATFAGFWYWWSAPGREDVQQYITEKVGKGDIVVLVTATGTVEPTNQVDISSELSGTIRSVEVDYNSIVKKGQILARLDTDKLEATVEHAKASLIAKQARASEMQTTLEEMRSAYERTQSLEKKGIASAEALLKAKASFDRAKAGLKIAEADVRVAEADLKLNEANFAKACICSSIDGVVLDRNVNVGQIVASSLQAPVLFTLAEDLTKMELRVDIDEADIGKVKIGNEGSFTVEAYQNREFPAIISELRFAPNTVDGVVTYEAILLIDNFDFLLRPGMTATAEIEVSKVNEVMTVTNAALRFAPPTTDQTEKESGSGLLGMLFKDRPSAAPTSQNKVAKDGRRTIWVLRNNEAVAVKILPGVSDGLITEIVEGEVTPGDFVITDIAES